MSTDINLTAGLPAPTELPELPAAAGEQWWDVAAGLTGADAMRAGAASMITAGAASDDVAATLAHVDRQTQTLTELLSAVESVIHGGGRSELERPIQAVREVIA